MENLVVDKPDCIIVHAAANDITNDIISLNSAKIIVKTVKKTPQTYFGKSDRYQYVENSPESFS